MLAVLIQQLATRSPVTSLVSQIDKSMEGFWKGGFVEQNGLLLLRSCFRFKRKIRPFSVLRLYDLVSACSSTSAGQVSLFHLPTGAVIPSSSCCNNEFLLPFFQFYGFLWSLVVSGM